MEPYYDLNLFTRRGGEGYRLPTEAEWEYAARAGSTTQFSFGADDATTGDHAWFIDNAHDQTHPVGQRKPNAFGLYDMHGNVWEWCCDSFDPRYYAQSPGADPHCAAQPRSVSTGAGVGPMARVTSGRPTGARARRRAATTTWGSAWPVVSWSGRNLWGLSRRQVRMFVARLPETCPARDAGT